MKKFKFIWILVGVLCLSLTGCDDDLELKYVKDKLQITTSQLTVLQKQFNNIKSNVSEFCYGENLALLKGKQPSQIDLTIKKLNDRIQAIVGLPDKNQVLEITDIVDNLTSELVAQQKIGDALLSKKDMQISNNQKQIDQMVVDLNKQQKEFTDKTTVLLAKADTAEKELDNLHKWFGIYEIIDGFKRLFMSAIWFAVGGTVIFFAIRVLSGLNISPIFNTILSGFKTVGGVVLSGIKFIIPGAFAAAGFVEKEIIGSIQNKTSATSSISSSPVTGSIVASGSL